MQTCRFLSIIPSQNPIIPLEPPRIVLTDGILGSQIPVTF